MSDYDYALTQVTVKYSEPLVTCNNIIFFAFSNVSFLLTLKPNVALTSFDILKNDVLKFMLCLFCNALRIQICAVLSAVVIQFKLLLRNLTMNIFVMHAIRTHFYKPLCHLTNQIHFFCIKRLEESIDNSNMRYFKRRNPKSH